MSLKLNHALKLLTTNGYKVDTILKRIEPGDIKKAGKEKFAKEVYQELGGIQENFPAQDKIRTFIEPNIMLLIDEDLHFNRYRSLTLKSEIYRSLPDFPLENYRRYCRSYEKECIKAGLKAGTWSNKESDYYFGPSSSPGDFFRNGSGGWKLNAFKDYLEDLYWPSAGYKLLRFAVYDHIMADGKLVRIDSILERPAHPLQQHLLKFLERRINSLLIID